MEETQKYVCLLPTDGYAIGDVVDLTEEQFAGHNANEPEPRFAPFEEAEDAPAEGEEVAPTEPVAPEAPAEEVAPVSEGEDAGGASQEGTDADVTETAPEGEATVATDGEGA